MRVTAMHIATVLARKDKPIAVVQKGWALVSENLLHVARQIHGFYHDPRLTSVLNPLRATHSKGAGEVVSLFRLRCSAYGGKIYLAKQS